MRIGQVIAAGLVAGLWINLSGMASVHLMLGPEYVKTLVSHLPGPPGISMLVRHLSLRFGLGIAGVALYAMLRPQFDSLLSCSATASAFLFLAAYVPLSAMLNELAILVGWRLWAALAWGAAEVFTAMLLGAYLLERMRARATK